MFQISKKIEYGLIAISYMASQNRGRIFTTKEISDTHHLSYELLAKIMQKLTKHGYIASYQGVNGGYILTRDPAELKVSEIINAIEGKRSVSLVKCESTKAENCSIHTTCTIKNPMVKLQNNINKMLEELTVMEMFG